jgi:hypothetical protein
VKTQRWRFGRCGALETLFKDPTHLAGIGAALAAGRLERQNN